MSLSPILRKALDGAVPSDADIRRLIELPDGRLPELLDAAHRIRLARFGNRVSLCAIVNARSGRCSEDCAFCAQSARHRAESPVYPLISPEEIETAGRAARAAGAARFGVVLSGMSPSEGDLASLAESVARLARLGLAPDLSAGILAAGRLKTLKKAGLAGYHHNLETSRTFFPRICTTHGYDEDVDAVRNAIEAGLHVCSGGIFGIGETWDDRVELALLLRELGVDSVPINFLHPAPGTPLADRTLLSPEEALRIVAVYRFLLPDRALRICGGRPTVFGAGRKGELLTAGASGLMIGDYLTTKGGDVASDFDEMKRAGLVPADGDKG
ncbi:biotin synthase BioB [Pseudodesulfovibrio sp.]|uniref:biotin synthase BioB n=1 Tax=Pseudodesulfovibrio sp. TaxID=2035812 RepID=UPI00261DCC25|nr:biotin synthase BioB [Pseudodesulfovibrio sp.]MDD3312909.1 biotin synthase BioB [Pseudodesulfovibrio sp.]